MQNEEKTARFSLAQIFKKKNALFIAGLAGILLIALSDLLLSPGRQSTKQSASGAEGPDMAQHLADTETRLRQMLESVEGVGKVRVMVTLEDSGETVYALNEHSDTLEQGEGGTQTQRKSTYQSEHVLYDAGSGKRPLVETQGEPEVRGVAVVCEGGDNITVVKRVTELVAVVLGLSTNRICVTKMI